MTTGRELINRRTGEVIEVESEAISVSPAYVQETMKSIALLQDMTRNLLKRGRDFGRTPGTPTDGLWDPGASIIIAGFNCYAGQRRVLSMVDEEEKISIIVEVPILSRQSGREVSSGIGAASTLETKYKYRWLYESELKDTGYTPEQIATLKTSKKHPGKYRIDNMERGELLNTLIKQASKRAEVDAAEALPGVASVLRELFDPRNQGEAGEKSASPETTVSSEPDDEDSPRWTTFWSGARALGLSAEEVHQKLGVKSMKDWQAAGKSLDDAIRVLSDKVGKKPPAPAAKKPSSDMVYIKSAAKKLGWGDERLLKELKDRAGYTRFEDVPDDKLAEFASKLTDLAECT